MAPESAGRWFATAPCPWWIGGGWAIDLFLGENTRPHRDLDVGIFRRDELTVRALLPEWEFCTACDGRLRPLAHGDLTPRDSHSIWCRRPASSAWTLELVLEESDGDSWIFRDEPRIRRPISEIYRTTVSGMPFLAPEIEILYKARTVRPKDLQDFEALRPHLSVTARSWLVTALAEARPGHAWLEALRWDGQHP